MKVLTVLDAFYPSIDGPTNVITYIAKIANQQNLAQMELLVPKYKEKVEIDGIKVHRCKSIKAMEGYRASLPMFDKSVKKLIKTGGYDLIHIHSPFTLGKGALKYAKKYKIPVLFTMHTSYKDDFRRILKCKALRKFMMHYIMSIINKCDYVSTVSNGASDMLREYGYNGKEVFVIRNGTDMKPTQIAQSDIAEIKKTYGLENKFVFLFVGRVVENKNIQFSLKVLKELKDSGVNNFKFLIVGSGSYENELKKLTEQYGLGENVVFTGRIADRNYLAKIYASADLFMFPSTFDTCGIVAIEAAVNKLPSAMLENCCASEVICHKQNGLALPNDPKAWKDEIINVIEDKNLISTMRENAFNTIYTSWETITKQYIDFYKKILNKEV